jgi:hypothetical protein
LVSITAPSFAAQLVVYDDQLGSGFEDWSWAQHDLQQTTIVHSGTRAISMIPANWEGLFLHRAAGINVEENGILELWVHGGTTGHQAIRLVLQAGSQVVGDALLQEFVEGGTIPAGAWARAVVPFSALGLISGVFDGIILQANAQAVQPTIYFDDLILLDTAGPPPPIRVTVDPEADRRAINPRIYGVNLGSTNEFAALPYPVRRWGGNHLTRYNWRKDATNRASDWFFINLPEGSADSTGLPANSSADRWVDQTLARAADAVVTIPTIGWVARDRVKRWGFSIARYGPQQENECSVSGWPSWCAADAGNGVRPDGSRIAGNNPHDTSVEVGPSFTQEWLSHLLGQFGTADEGGIRFYAMDNEPMLWSETHRDVHPNPATLDELWQRTQAYAEAVKAIDPTAQILGPVVWGWCAYFYSAADGCAAGPDMAAHGGLPLLEWYLTQNRARELETGQRPVDYLDVHYYPQAPNVSLTSDESEVTAALRLRSLRSLYDPSYVDESWIGQPVRLIPRMRSWIDARCPGMKLAITEYNWGGDQGISSALAQAEALAIFGREGVDLATRWVAPQAGSRVLDAFRLYLDYDGQGHSLSGESVRATSNRVDDVGAYAVRLDASHLALLLFNKATTERTATTVVAGSITGEAKLYRFDDTASLHLAGIFPVSGDSLALALPARSASLLLLERPTVSTSRHQSPDSVPRLTAYPSPFASGVVLRYDLRAPTTAIILVCDAAGRIVRRLDMAESDDAGWHSVVWDGRDAKGRMVPAGNYFVRLEAAGEEATARVVRVKR